MPIVELVTQLHSQHSGISIINLKSLFL